MGKQKGFTLIELVIVVVILGVLSAIAIPKFLNISKDARIAVIQGVAGSLSFVVRQVYIESVLQGKNKQGGPNGTGVSVEVNGVDIKTWYGSPHEKWPDIFEHLLDVGGEIKYLGKGFSNSGAALNVECTGSSLCVVDQAQTNRVSGAPYSDNRAFGIYFVPRGKAVNDRCYAFYAFKHVENVGITYSEVSTVETGC